MMLHKLGCYGWDALSRNRSVNIYPAMDWFEFLPLHELLGTIGSYNKVTNVVFFSLFPRLVINVDLKALQVPLG